MLVITNRYVNEKIFHDGIGNQNAFGEQVNQKGPNEIRLAHATKKEKDWEVQLISEPKNLTTENAPSRTEYRRIVKKCLNEGKHCLFFVHGFNKTFLDTLEQGWFLERRYGIEVVLFSWSSNPGGLLPRVPVSVSEYRKSRRIAQASFGALDSAFEKLGRYIQEEPFDKEALVNCPITLNLMTYSLGNYLFQNYVVSNDYAAETKIFTNVVLCQADVDGMGHVSWVDKIVAGQRVYITINENDKVLGWSESVNNSRLGRTLSKLNSINAIYIDFTSGKDVGNKHQLWGEVENVVTKSFFKAIFDGKRGENVSGLTYDGRVNAFRVS
jgi:esterase/lipase superfamily enzyme